jgi:hypothetical protein
MNKRATKDLAAATSAVERLTGQRHCSGCYKFREITPERPGRHVPAANGTRRWRCQVCIDRMEKERA